MKTYTFKAEQLIAVSLSEAWDFFSSPSNLSKLTPAELNLVVTSNTESGIKMYPGMIITYKVSPILGIKMNWMTEITHVREHEYFVDEQRFGPFALWHHEHHFKTVKGGVLMTDLLHYAIPYRAIGRLANAIFVDGQIKKIFGYRRKAIEELF